MALGALGCLHGGGLRNKRWRENARGDGRRRGWLPRRAEQSQPPLNQSRRRNLERGVGKRKSRSERGWEIGFCKNQPHLHLEEPANPPFLPAHVTASDLESIANQKSIHFRPPLVKIASPILSSFPQPLLHPANPRIRLPPHLTATPPPLYSSSANLLTLTPFPTPCPLSEEASQQMPFDAARARICQAWTASKFARRQTHRRVSSGNSERCVGCSRSNFRTSTHTLVKFGHSTKRLATTGAEIVVPDIQTLRTRSVHPYCCTTSKPRTWQRVFLQRGRRRWL